MKSWAGKIAGSILFLVLAPLLLAILLLAAPIIAITAVYDRWRQATLQRAFVARWAPAGKDVLLVYSNSPYWKDYVETHWLPSLQARAVVLNWSERTSWNERYRLEAAVFRRWAGAREFNPIAIIIPRRGPVKVVRFWQAFRDYKHGRESSLRAAERQMADALGIPLPVGA